MRHAAAASVCLTLLGAAPANVSTLEPQSIIVNSVGFVRGSIAGAGPYWFLIDTGANRSAVDSKIASELRLVRGGSSKVEGSAGSIDVQEALIPDVQIGATSLRNLRPTVSDLSSSLSPPGEHIAAILRSDALRSLAVLWDRAEKHVVIGHNAERLASLYGATIVPFELDNGIPSITARIDGVPVRLRIDTGASIGDGPATFVNVTQSFYDALHARDPALRAYTFFSAKGVGGETRIPVVQAHSLIIGHSMTREPRLIVQPKLGYFARSDSVGFLGTYSFSQSSKIIIDYPHKRLILLPARKVMRQTGQGSTMR